MLESVLDTQFMIDVVYLYFYYVLRGKDAPLSFQCMIVYVYVPAHDMSYCLLSRPCAQDHCAKDAAAKTAGSLAP